MILNNQVALFCGNARRVYLLPVNLVLWQHEVGFQKWRRCRKGASFYWSPRPTRKPIRDRAIWWYLFKCSALYRHCMMTDNWCFWERVKGLRQAKPFDSKDGHGQKQEKKNNPQASVSVQSVYAIGICCDQAMIHKRLSAYSHQHPTDQKSNFNLVWTDWDALNCSGVVDSLDTVCALTQIKWQLSVWLLSDSQELCMWMIRTLFCVSILRH